MTCGNLPSLAAYRLFRSWLRRCLGAIVGFVALALVSAMYGIYHQVQV